MFKLVVRADAHVITQAGVAPSGYRACDAEELRVEVMDAGKGFEWQLDMFGARSGGFGLWSIGDRVFEAGGRFTVDTAPGRGARFEMVFPVGAASAASRMTAGER